MRGASRSGQYWIQAALLCAVAASAACSSGRTGPSPAELEQARAKASALVDEGYQLKTTGRNEAALARFASACSLLEHSVGPDSQEVASCLDDQASVLVRTGEYERAEQLYYRALRIAEGADGTDPLLISGVRYRIGLLGRLEQLHIRCAEPATPRPDDPVPYFPEIVEMQRSLAALAPDVRSCASGPVRPLTLKVTVTGDGRPVMAEARGADSGTEVGKCAESHVIEAIPRAELPPFRACFRAFTYPFPVGEADAASTPAQPAP